MSSDTMLSVCFVCGSPGAAYSLRSKPRENGAYFPFLETHDPPKGARLPNAEGIVEGCRVCYSILNQQWDSFEASNTPAMKRLYWLKRNDNGNYTGAEMRLQGEYAAQMMGLQYHPTPGAGTMSPYDYATPKASSSRSNVQKTTSPSPSRPISTPTSRPLENDGGALDLSFGSAEKKPPLKDRPNSKNQAVVKPKTEPMDTSGFMCFLCGNEQSISMACFIFAQRYTEDEPYFPFLTRIPIPPGVTMSASRGYQVCRSCKNCLHSQFESYKTEATTEQSQIYSINNMVVSGNAPIKHRTRSPTGCEGCYLCGQEYQRLSMKQLNTRPPAESSKYSMYFPFIISLQCPKAAKPIDLEGRVYSCRACYSYLQRQWQAYQNDNIPMERRQFVLRPLTELGKESPLDRDTPEVTQPLNIRVSSAQGGSTVVTTDQSTTASYMAAAANALMPPGLLAIAPHLSPQVMLSSMYGAHPQLYYPPPPPPPTAATPTSTATKPDGKSPAKSTTPQDIKRPPSSTGNSGKSSPGKSRDLYSKSMVVKSRTTDSTDAEHCFICGSRCGGKICKLRAHPSQPETIDSRHMEPFFPFITNQEPSPKSRRLSVTGSANTCRFCFFHLLNQWKEYEKSTHEADSNRWMRRYNYKIYVCYTCGILTPRSDVKTLNTKKFSTLPLQPKPSMGVQMEDDGSVVVCRGCRDDLQRQYDSFDKQGVPVPQRHFLIQNKGAHSIGYFMDEDGSSKASSSGGGGDNAANATRQASFAAALRKLAKQAEGPDPHENHQQRNNTSSSPSVDNKRNNLINAPHQSPPTTLHNHYSTASSSSHNNDQQQSQKASDVRTSAAAAAGLMVDTIKQEHHGKVTPSSNNPHNQPEARPDSRPHSTNSSARVTPHLAMSSVPPPPSAASSAAAAQAQYDNAVAAAAAAARGFQPYRGGGVPTSVAGYPPTSSAAAAYAASLDPMASYSAAAAAYQHALMSAAAQHPFAQHGFRLDDPLLLERYRMLQHPLAAAAAAGYPHPGLMPPQSYLGSGGAIRYPPELLAQHLAYLPPGSKLPEHLTSPGAAAAERAKAEEEMRQREKEAAEKEREERARREKEEREKREKEERERRERQEREQREKERLEREKQLREAERGRSPATAQDLSGRGRSDFSAERLLSNKHAPPSHHALSAAHYNGKDPLLRHLENNEARDKNMLLHQFLQEQDYILRESGLMGGYAMMHPAMAGLPGGGPNPEPRDFSTKPRSTTTATVTAPQSLTSSLMVAATTTSSSNASLFHRPFERGTERDQPAGGTSSDRYQLPPPPPPPPLTNGYDSKSYAEKYAEYDRRLQAERDRMLREHAAAQEAAKAASNSLTAAKNHVDGPVPRLDKQYLDYHNRKIEERKPTTTATTAATTTQSQQQAAVTSVESYQARLLEHHNTAEAAAAAKQYYQQYHQHLQQQAAAAAAAVVQQQHSNHHQHPQSAAPPPQYTTTATTTNTIASTTASAPLPPPPSHSLNPDLKFSAAPTDPVPVVSKLDIVEKRLNEARRNGTFDSDAESDMDELIEPKEETKLQKLLLITDGPPMAMNKSPQKLQYLGQFGLTTQETKNEVEFHQQCKRRRLYREPSVSPIELQHSNSSSNSAADHSTLQYPPTAIHPDELNREPHYKQKARFLNTLGLEPVPPERRRQLEHIRKVCEWDKTRRVGTTQEPHNIGSFILSQPELPTEQNPLKRKHSNDVAHVLNNIHKEVTSQLTVGGKIPNGPNGPNGPKAPVPRAVIFPESDKNRTIPASISREFAEEFHKSVLQTTRQQQESKAAKQKAAAASGVDYSLPPPAHPSTLPPPSPLPTTSSSSSSSVPVPSPNKLQHRGINSNIPPPPPLITPPHPPQQVSPAPSSEAAPAWRWPGIEAVMEGYQQNERERILEKRVLTEHGHMLSRRNLQLHQTYDRFNSHLNDLTRTKQAQDEERKRNEASIEHLKRIMRDLKKR